MCGMEESTVGVIIVDHGSRRSESNQMLEAFVEMFRAAGRFGVVEAAHMELASPSIAEAFDRCVARGAKRIVVSPYFLSPGKHWNQDIPQLAAAAAAKHPGVEFLVTAPIGLHPMMVDVVGSRIEHCLAHAAGRAAECDVCAGSGRCVLRQG